MCCFLQNACGMFFIFQVSIEQKLPSLYLMDSIVKNIGEEYITAVSPLIVALFTHVFEQVCSRW